MLALVLATLFLVMTHLVPSAPGLRPRLVARWGLHGFRLGYSLLSLAALAWVVLAYRAADPGLWLYAPPGAARILAVALMPVALLLILCRLTTPPRGREPVGIYRITATPGSLGVLLWCGLHLLNLGAVRSLVLFSGMALIAAGAIVANLR
ncbi:MAG TPA: NnrU family protein, partial [Alphaproteobacteria bacterium]|nr:NnrU family protein [Alphaproteobacteria bacterium]